MLTNAQNEISIMIIIMIRFCVYRALISTVFILWLSNNFDMYARGNLYRVTNLIVTKIRLSEE